MEVFLKKGKKSTIFYLFLVFLFFQSGIFLVSAVNSSLSILNSAPFLNENIPNQSWASNMNLTNAFRLNDHFLDDNGDQLSFNNSFVDNITVLINESTTYVSFYPEIGFAGNKTVTFYATDLYSAQPSNLVHLLIGQDNEAPKWFNVNTSSQVISQNDLVNFSARWTDNFQLKGFIFSINQGSSWVNYSSQSFEGIEAYASYRIQISAAPSSIVYWKIYAWDSSYNMNVTDTQSFTLTASNIPTNPPSGGSSGGSDSSGGSSSGGSSGQFFESILQKLGITVPKNEDFDFNIDSFEAEIIQGLEKSIFFKIRNTGTSSLDFDLATSSLEKLIFLDEKKFSLSSGSEKGVLIDIKIPENYLPGQYFSYLVIHAGNLEKTIPFVITIKPFNPSVLLNITVSPDSLLVSPGKNVTFDLEISQKNDTQDLDAFLYMALKDSHGNIYDSLEENITIYHVLKLDKSLSVPKDAKEGEYIVYGQIEYSKGVTLDSAIFEVGYRFKLAAILQWGGTFLMISILAIIFVLLAMKYERNKRKEKLLSLYLLLSKLKENLAKNDLISAADIYIKIKTNYGEGAPKDLISDKEFLKRELHRLSEGLNNNYKEVTQKKDEQKEAKKDEPKKEKIKEEKDRDEKK